LVREHLQGTPLEPIAETAELVVSEVVTNAIVHTGAGIEVAAVLDDTGLRVEVADSSKHLPVVASYDATASTGRGLHLVAELTDQWGVETRPDGKVFWFHMGLSVRDEGPPETDMSISGVDHIVREAQNTDVTVELLNMPALMHAAWQQHAKSLLRDLLLLGIEVEASHKIEAHAAAMDALAILGEQVRPPEVDQDPAETISSQAPLEAAHVKVHVVVPKDSVPHFETLDQQLESALSHASAGRLLTPPMQPEFGAFRRWMCEQVKVQAEGEPARPWEPTLGEAATSWDANAVSTSPRALIGADRTGSIIAASPAAAELLGYVSPSGLVGRRLRDLIPARYHRTHLAGFTLHQLAAGSPLLGLSAVVPARCCDGTEVEVQLSLTASLGPDGSSIFVADLQPA
jgi:PAS domain S-box-containing protein